MKKTTDPKEADILRVSLTRLEWLALEELVKQVTDDPHESPDMTDAELGTLIAVKDILFNPVTHDVEMFVIEKF